MKIQIIEVPDDVRHGIKTYDGSFTVITDGRFADGLCRDEALGLVAALLFDSPVVPPWLKTPEQWQAEKWNKGKLLPEEVAEALKPT